MQPAKNPAQSHSVQNSRLPGFVIALLIFGVLKGWPLILAQAQELVVPPPASPQNISKEVIPEVIQKETVSFDEKYKDWPMVMPLHETRITVNRDGSFEAYVHRKVVIQKKEGNAMGEIPIQYDSDTETVRLLKAVTITPDGKEHPPAKVQERNLYEGYGMYSGAKEQILSMPEVTPGAMIELEYVKTTKRLPMPGAFWDIEYAQQAFPIKDQIISFKVTKSPAIPYKSFIKNWKPEVQEEGDATVYRWQRKNYAPDTDPEEELQPMPTPETVGDGIEFSSVKNWQEVAVWYYGLIQKNLKITPEIQKAARKATKGKTTVRDKVRSILEYMQENFRYVSMSFGDYSMEPHPTGEVFRNKYGDCKDQSLLAKAMLQVVGIESDLVLFMTEYSGSDPKDDLPVLGLYDHVLLKVRDPEGDFYADPLLEGYDIEEYPADYQGAYLLVIAADGGKFERFPIFTEDRMSESIKETVTIRPDGSSVDEEESSWSLSDSIDFRKQMKSKSGEEREKFFEYLSNQIAGGGKVLETVWDGLDSKYGRIKTHVKTDRPDQYPVKGGLMVIDLPEQSGSDGFSQKERKHPIFFPANVIKTADVTYVIPDGFEVMHLPENLDLENGFYSLKRTVEQTGSSINVKEIKRLRRIELPATDYSKIKEFYDKLPAETEQRIILKQK
ncbi:MAG TPA: DUF3857 domain-containing protein [Candidatus Omnitrophota bacterium]|nr:DUF3857 domain-containing protein [Candidatus Omnitrophota bacterium]